jgi:hypothetical protein
MIVKSFDNGWGPEWPAKAFEVSILNPMLQELVANDSKTIVINSTWYSQDYHQQVLTQLRNLDFSHLVLVAMLDPAIPQPDWFKEFDCKIFCVGYYPGPYSVDYWALFTHQHNLDVPAMQANLIDIPYMCLNRKPHWHRQRLYQQLQNLDIVDRGLVSFGQHRTLLIDREHDNFAPEATAEKFGVPNDIASLGHPGNWNRSFLNIVTETAWNISSTGFVSEKIYKPMIGCRPFLVYDTDGATTWLSARGFESYVSDFEDISSLDLSDPGCMAPFLKVLVQQPKHYWQKKFVDLYDKIMYNKNQFEIYIAKQKSIIEKGIQCQI